MMTLAELLAAYSEHLAVIEGGLPYVEVLDVDEHYSEIELPATMIEALEGLAAMGEIELHYVSSEM